MTDLVVREQRPYELTEKQVTIIANTEFVPADKRGKHDLIWAAIFKGRSIGIDDFTALNEIHIVNGKPGLSAALAAGLVRQRGHKIDGQMSSESATARGVRADNGSTLTVVFTMEDAKNAGLAGKGVWKSYPQSMLWARAVTQLCRSLFSDCFIGGVYTPEELGADVVLDEDVIVEGEIADSSSEREDECKNGVDPEFGRNQPASSPPRSLDEFVARCKTENLKPPVVQAKWEEMFPGKTLDKFTASDWGSLWNELTKVAA
jgi:hypothetical protein